MDKIISEQMLDALRERVGCIMSGKRFSHTLGVEREIEKLAVLYAPEKSMMLRAAALLHDITKEYTNDRHLALISEYGLDVEYYKAQSPKLYHSATAALIIPDSYPEYADSELIHAVSVHTAGCVGMSISDKLLFLADYIEDTRTFEDCVTLRNFFWEGISSGKERLRHLDRTVLLAFDMTLKDLIENNNIISDKTVEARNSLLCKMKKGE
ncbi:MAG: HD domain-containing protein [Clostridia bacterium]|nr:HD domain-containing protein [Clostridia bacterium]